MTAVLQPSLLDAVGLAGTVERTALSDGAWFDLCPA